MDLFLFLSWSLTKSSLNVSMDSNIKLGARWDIGLIATIININYVSPKARYSNYWLMIATLHNQSIAAIRGKPHRQVGHNLISEPLRITPWRNVGVMLYLPCYLAIVMQKYLKMSNKVCGSVAYLPKAIINEIPHDKKSAKNNEDYIRYY